MLNRSLNMKSWGVSDSLKLYNIENWGDRYFNINPAGNLVVYPRQGAGAGIDLMRVVEEVRAQTLGFPVLIRFQDIIRHRVEALNEAFRKTIVEAGYSGVYRGVYPIKVNQMREVVEEILDAGRPYDYGLEAGSKAELAAVIGMDVSPDALIICNGYKDYHFIKTALLGRKLGKNVIIVVEKLSELTEILRVGRELNVQPWIGVRCKLASKGSGKWESSGGESAKFGLSTPELLQVIATLKRDGNEEILKLLHFHIGSQINDIGTVKDAVKEATRIYAKIVQLGIPLKYLDVGGGLGVDYDGSRTSYESSINYSLQEYVADVVYSVQEICKAEKVKEPNLVSESGRAIAAHHSALVVNVFGSIEMSSDQLPEFPEEPGENAIVGQMREILTEVSPKNFLEHFHEAVQRKEEALSMFKLGILSLQDRAKVEQLYWQVCKQIYEYSRELRYVPEEIESLGKYLADQYLCNFSVFQSMPDHWAIQQLFPIVPLHRHDEEPTHDATLVDITCDSDGKISKFIDLRDIKDTLRLHALKEAEPYYLGLFMMGAYQDIMGDLHNLFGRVNEVHVFLDETEPGGYYIEEVIRGNNISGVLSWIQYSPVALEKRVKEQIDVKVKEGVLKPREGVDLLNFYEAVLNGYTYMDSERPMVVAWNGEVAGNTPAPLTSTTEGNKNEASKLRI